MREGCAEVRQQLGLSNVMELIEEAEQHLMSNSSNKDCRGSFQGRGRFERRFPAREPEPKSNSGTTIAGEGSSIALCSHLWQLFLEAISSMESNTSKGYQPCQTPVGGVEILNISLETALNRILELSNSNKGSISPNRVILAAVVAVMVTVVDVEVASSIGVNEAHPFLQLCLGKMPKAHLRLQLVHFIICLSGAPILATLSRQNAKGALETYVGSFIICLAQQLTFPLFIVSW